MQALTQPFRTDADFQREIDELTRSTQETTKCVEDLEKRINNIKQEIINAKASDLSFLENRSKEFSATQKVIGTLGDIIQENQRNFLRIMAEWQLSKNKAKQSKAEITQEYLTLTSEEERLSKLLKGLEQGLNPDNFSELLVKKKTIDELKPKLQAVQEAIRKNIIKAFGGVENTFVGKMEKCSQEEFQKLGMQTIPLQIQDVQYIFAPMNNDLPALCIKIKKPAVSCDFRAITAEGFFLTGNTDGILKINAIPAEKGTVTDAGKDMLLIFLPETLWHTTKYNPQIDIYCSDASDPMTKIGQLYLDSPGINN